MGLKCGRKAPTACASTSNSGSFGEVGAFSDRELQPPSRLRGHEAFITAASGGLGAVQTLAGTNHRTSHRSAYQLLRIGRLCGGGGIGGQKGLADIRILQTMVSGILLMLGRRARFGFAPRPKPQKHRHWYLPLLFFPCQNSPRAQRNRRQGLNP